jgi:hypothetical protein
MLLNKLPVLDKGYVALVSSSNNGETLKNIKGLVDLPLHELVEISSLTLAIKAPLFVQLYLSKFQFKIWNILQEKPEAFTPDVTDINCPDHAVGTMIANDMAVTTAALLINPKAYQKDGCDYFISQVITPISVYNELVVHGTLKQWLEFTQSMADVPKPIQGYILAVSDIIRNEWKHGEKEATQTDSI